MRFRPFPSTIVFPRILDPLRPITEEERSGSDPLIEKMREMMETGIVDLDFFRKPTADS